MIFECDFKKREQEWISRFQGPWSRNSKILTPITFSHQFKNDSLQFKFVQRIQ